MNEFNLKLSQLKEGKTYQRESGGFVVVRNADFLFADSLTDDFVVSSELGLHDKFKLSTVAAPETLRELLTAFTEGKNISAKERYHEKLLFKIVEEIENLKK